MDWPLILILTGLFVVGAAVATLLNAAIYAWAWTPRRVSPWQPAPEGVSPRTWADRLPIVGWLRSRRPARWPTTSAAGAATLTWRGIRSLGSRS